jgi:hypothetical protein
MPTIPHIIVLLPVILLSVIPLHGLPLCPTNKKRNHAAPPASENQAAILAKTKSFSIPTTKKEKKPNNFVFVRDTRDKKDIRDKNYSINYSSRP